MNKSLKLGQINFINCLPINLPLNLICANKAERSTLNAQIHTALSFERFALSITAAYPSQINHLLRNGDIDLAPISSFEYLSNPNKYKILEGISISSKTQADSVLLFARDLDTMLNSKEIYLTNKSASSVNLLKIILEKKFHKDLSAIDFKIFEDNSDEYPVKLLIGDEALKANTGVQTKCYNYVLDLGTAWYELTKLPMVFALWCFNKNSPALDYYEEIKTLINSCRDQGLDTLLPDVIIEAYKQTGLPKATLMQYFNNLDYSFTEKHRESLELFQNYNSRFLAQKT